MASGAVAMGASWLLNAIGSSFAGGYMSVGDGYTTPAYTGVGGDLRFAPEWREVREYGWTPLVGPWMQLAASPVAFDQDAWGVWWIASGLVQAAGLATLIAGIGLRIDADANDASSEIALTVLPNASADSAGISILGRF